MKMFNQINVMKRKGAPTLETGPGGEVNCLGSREAAIFNLDTSMAADPQLGNIGQLENWIQKWPKSGIEFG